MSDPISFGEHWEFYPCRLNDRPYSVRFDVGVARLDEAVRAEYPHVLVVRILFDEAREDGLPTPGELTRINRIEDGLRPQGNALRHIGVLTGEGGSRFVFAVHRSAGDFEELARALLTEAGDVEYQLQVFEHDHFGYYLQVLAPSAYEQNWIYNRKVCENLQKNGDALEAPRDIDFFLYFAGEEAREAVAEDLLAAGYREVARDQKEDGAYSLHLVRSDVPEFGRINELTGNILQRMEDVEGYFDGWGCSVVR